MIERLSTIAGLLAILAGGAVAYGRLAQRVDDLHTLIEVRDSHLQSWIDELRDQTRTQRR